MAIDFLYNPYVLLFFTFWIFWSIYFIYNIYLFFKNKNSFYIKSRCPWLIFCSAIGQYLMMTSLTFRILVTPAKFPNFVSHWYIWLFIPCHMIPYPIRSLRFIIRYNVNKIPELTEEQHRHAKCSIRFWDWFRRHPKYLTDTAFLIYNWILVAIAFIVGIALYIKDPTSHPGNYGQHYSYSFFVWCLILLICFSVFHWITLYYISQFHDKLYFTIELAIVGVVWIIFMTLYIIFGWIRLTPAEIQPIMGILLCVGVFLASFGFPIQLSVTKPLEPTNTDKIFRHLEDVMEPNEHDDIMKNAKKKFRDFCEKRQCLEGFLFYDAVLRFRKEGDPVERTKLFRTIKERFIMKDAIWHINVLGSILNDILQVNENSINNEVLNDAFNENKKLLETDIFINFKCTKAAKDLLNDFYRRENVLVGYGHKNNRHNNRNNRNNRNNNQT